ncbi:dopamine beta-hydroxylase-like isoform X2 [Dreissena polymorpha]|uniref:dopamine beta-hydroxylase-like isoform X2 n=1 Tax=Dreissena polymorpha TaxID=45954 RepID=UPI0022643706|nr:dopamine beta-hydroxylase-like isoform X2 [Dreissena polymorpha]
MSPLRLLFSWAVLLPVALGYETFQARIPNGDRIPHHCGHLRMWAGLGHVIPSGGGELNPFGKDFKKANFTWTRQLCQMDSDGDGLANGAEMGDPDCVWSAGQVNPVKSNLSHPGICEPIESSHCQHLNKHFTQDVLSCQIRKDCQAMKEKDVAKLEIRMPGVSLHAQETTYLCMLVELPVNGTFHVVASAPILVSALVHHMILWGCYYPVDENVTEKIEEPYACGMTPSPHCQQPLVTWTYGLEADCHAQDAGLRIGQYGAVLAALQVHYHNPNLLSGQTDTSGIAIYYTPHLRQFDASTFMVGQQYLHIPPRSKNVRYNHTCPGICTAEMFKKPVYITRAANHMHYLGVAQTITVIRNGRKVFDLTKDDKFDYDRPVFYHFDPPIKVMPSDEIVTECVYNSQRNTSTYFGAGTYDEMCYGFLTYYPRQEFEPTLCVAWKSVQRCIRKLETFNGMYGDCNWKQFVKHLPQNVSKVLANDTCGQFQQEGVCNWKCSLMSRDLLSHVCLQGDMGEFLIDFAKMTPYVKVLTTCAKHTARNSASFIVCTGLHIRLTLCLYLMYFSVFF